MITATPKAASAAKDQKSAAIPVPKPVHKKHGFFASEPITEDYVPNEEAENNRHKRMHRMLHLQTIAIVVLSVVLVFVSPILKPIYHYYARNPEHQTLQLDPLLMPNITDRAVLSWAVTSVTEIMTFGFGDVVAQLGLQKPRFTATGWESFVTAFKRQRINETFKENQLVLTTVPSDTAVILGQGPNEFGVYQWKVQVPVVMTYATNNNITQPHRGVISLLITRVDTHENPTGIAIRKWTVDK